jgi:hypothetical protein
MNILILCDNLEMLVRYGALFRMFFGIEKIIFNEFDFSNIFFLLTL